MADYQRGVYEPSDEVRVFDGSEDEEDTEGSRLPLLIVIALFVLAAFGGVVWLAYEKGVASGRTEPRTLVADSGPAKVAPDDAGESATPYKGLKIYEQPAPNEGNDGTTVETAPAGAPVQNQSSETPAPRLRAPLTDAPAAANAPSHQRQADVASAPSTPPAPSPKPAPSRVAAVEPAPAPAPSAASPPASASAPVAQGDYLLQIGSYKSQAEADASWTAFEAKHTSLVSGFAPNVKQADLGEKGTWFRLRLGPFADKDSASAMCDRIKADGGNCFLSK